MAKKNKKGLIILEDVELKPQAIGYTYQKKSNLGRVIFIFIIFLAVVFKINDISVIINKLIGKDSAETIENLAGNKNENNKENNENNNIKNEFTYNIYNSDLIITEKNITLNNFNLINNVLTFDINNNTNKKIDLSQNKYYIELYTENKTLLERFKIDINTINENSKISYSLNISNNFHYIVLEEKSINDYPIVNLESDESGFTHIICTKDIETIDYVFKNNELETIKHTISDNDINDINYYTRYNDYQNKITTYNKISGIVATFNGTLNGYTGIITIDLSNTNLSTLKEKYYYGYKEKPKVVKFEMQTYGFNCN